jgi:hypothetical protein
MKSCITRLRWILAAGVLLGFALAARAGEGTPARLTEADYAAFTKLRLAKAVVEEKSMFAHGNKEKQAAIDAQLTKVLAETGWTKERFEQVNDAVDSVVSALSDPEQPMDPEMDQTTIATVKAHRKELEDYNGLTKRAQQQIQEEQILAKRGPPPTAAEIAGKWVLNVELSVASISDGTPDELTKKLADEYRKNLTVATYTFGPGDMISAINQRPGRPPETTQGTYRLEGSTLLIKAKMGTRDREDKVDVGIKDGRLYIGMMGAYSVFERQ